jgi:hypothetical protein
VKKMRRGGDFRTSLTKLMELLKLNINAISLSDNRKLLKWMRYEVKNNRVILSGVPTMEYLGKFAV